MVHGLKEPDGILPAILAAEDDDDIARILAIEEEVQLETTRAEEMQLEMQLAESDALNGKFPCRVDARMLDKV